MGLGSIQPLTEMCIRNLPGGNGCPEREADLTAICETTIWIQKVGASTFHNLMGLHGLLQGYENDVQTYLYTKFDSNRVEQHVKV
jgi:hypothetical protein